MVKYNFYMFNKYFRYDIKLENSPNLNEPLLVNSNILLLPNSNNWTI